MAQPRVVFHGFVYSVLYAVIGFLSRFQVLTVKQIDGVRGECPKDLVVEFPMTRHYLCLQYRWNTRAYSRRP